MTADDILYVHVDPHDTEAAVSALLGRPVTVRDTAPTVVARPDPRTPQQHATGLVQIAVWQDELAGHPVELQTHRERIPSPYLHATQPDPHRRAWFVRVVPHEAHLCLLACGRRDGADHVKVGSPLWLGYPPDWSPAAEQWLRQACRETVRDLLARLEMERIREKNLDRANLLPGTGMHREDIR